MRRRLRLLICFPAQKPQTNSIGAAITESKPTASHRIVFGSLHGTVSRSGYWRVDDALSAPRLCRRLSELAVAVMMPRPFVSAVVITIAAHLRPPSRRLAGTKGEVLPFVNRVIHNLLFLATQS
jgi:hypothetical protein